jgi:nucleotide-binding universal stress UspA family protein
MSSYQQLLPRLAAGDEINVEGPPIMYERIVVGTDGSKQALDAVRTAGQLAELAGAVVHAVAVSRPYSAQEMSRIQRELPAEFHELVNPQLDATDRLSEAKALLPASLEVMQHEMSGDPADGILAVAESVKADLIVVGARGISTVERFVRGSVSTRVAHHSPCDVLIVEHDD